MQYLTALEVSLILKVQENTIYQWARRGVISFDRLGEKCVRFRKEDIEEFMTSGRNRPFKIKKENERPR